MEGGGSEPSFALGPAGSQAEAEFRRWARLFLKGEPSEDEKRLLGILVANFETAGELGTAHGKRAFWLREQWAKETSPDPKTLLSTTGVDARADFPIKNLKTLGVGPFRGFRIAEVIDLDRPLTLVYGPNGSGKSSLCEALEFSMLGYIEEAKAKRIELSEYVRNSPTGAYEAPVLTAIHADGSECPVDSDPDTFQFCFIEKNRIENFARLSATTPADQAQRIASLFGLQDFGSFVDGFTDNFDRYLSLEPAKPKELEDQRAKIAIHRQTIADEAKRKRELDQTAVDMAERAGLGVAFGDLSAALYGIPDEGTPGRLAELDALLEDVVAPRALPEVVDEDGLAKAASRLYRAYSDYAALRSELAAQASSLDFARLFEAVQSVEKAWEEPRCPACLTPLDQVVENPFSRASAELAALAELSELRRKTEVATEELVGASQDAEPRFREANLLADDLGVTRLFPDLSRLPSSVAGQGPAVETLAREAAESARTGIQTLAKLSDALADAINTEEEERKERLAARVELKRLQEVARELAAHEAKVSELANSVAGAKKAIEGFDTLEARLKNEIATEASSIESEKRLFSAYEAVIGQLRNHRRILPLILVEDLGEQVLEIYNAVNTHDPPFDLLEHLVLPQQVGDRLLIRFAGEEQEEDALKVLSEGHLRCLGVAILLAKNLTEERRLIVFDDVVNAVDDEHRSGIADVLINHPGFEKRQLLITSHGEEFLKLLSKRVPKPEFNDRVRQIDFLIPQDQRGVVVNRHPEPRHYLVRSANRIGEQRYREALGDHRRALEAVCETLWKRLGSKYNAALSVQIRAFGQKPDLRSVVSSLSAYLRKTVSREEADLADELVKLFGVITENWDELNRGTHEEEAQVEFDPVVVKILQGTLEDLESKLADRWKEL